MLCLPNTTCTNTWHYHYDTMTQNALHNQMAGCSSQQVEALLTILSSEDLAKTFSVPTTWGAADMFQALTYHTPRYWQPVMASLALAHLGPEYEGAVSYDDLRCKTCGTWVIKALDPQHWDSLCNSCYQHEDECECCSNCGCHPCECCRTCGELSWHCTCCPHCGGSEGYCECETCRNCGYVESECGCGSSSYSHFGSTAKVPWSEREDEPVLGTLPKMADCQHNEIDPLQAAADFYLLDAIKGMVRFGHVVGGDTERLTADRERILRADGMLAALRQSAERSYRALVDYLAPNFLAYALPAVGGELRYHKAVGKAFKASSREGAWDKFVDVVQAKGPETLFEADRLFREFGGGAYGGERWGNAAKVVGMYLSGQMPAWLFVDRVFTLEHNGGCFLNKVSWRRQNGLGWGLSKMNYVLNAHADKDASGDACGMTDWTLLMQVASPGVAQMFRLAERNISRIARRYGAVLPPVPAKSHIRKALDYSY